MSGKRLMGTSERNREGRQRKGGACCLAFSNKNYPNQKSDTEKIKEDVQ